MSSSRTWGRLSMIVAACAAGATGGCGSLLGLDDFTAAETSAASGGGVPTTTATGDATTSSTSDVASTGAGGSGGEGGSGAASTSTGAGGGGGEGGGDVTLTCDAGAPFVVFSSAELEGEPEDERIAVVTRPGSNRVHVVTVVGDPSTNRYEVVGRTVQAGAVPDLRQIIRYPSVADNLHRRVGGAYTTPESVHFWGHEGNRAGEFVFPGSDALEGPVTFHAYPTPQGCDDVRSLAVHQDEAGVVRFAATCVNPNQQAFLYGGTRTTIEFTIGPAAAVQGEPPPELAVSAFGRAGGQNVIFTADDGLTANEGGFVRVGQTTQELTSFLRVTPPEGHGLLFVGGPQIDGRLFLGALHANPMFEQGLDGAFRTGTLGPGDVASLVDDVPSVLEDELVFDIPNNVTPFFVLGRSGSLVTSAAATGVPGSIGINDVAFGAWHLDGRVAVDRYRVIEGSDGIYFLNAGTASAGFGTQAVVWTELVGDAYRIRAAGVQCLAAE